MKKLEAVDTTHIHRESGCLNEEIQIIEKKRYVSIEYLRVICVIFVFLIHFLENLEITETFTNLFQNCNFVITKFVNFTLCAIISTAVPVFVIISGFCNYKENEKITIKRYIIKILKNYIPYLIACCFYLMVNLYIKDIYNFQGLIIFAKSVTNFSLPYMWFMGSYFILLLLMPFINKLIGILTDNERIYLIFILIIAVCLPITVNIYKSEMLYIGFVKGFEFILFYAIGAYFKLNIEKVNKNFCFKFLLSSMLLIITTFVLVPISDTDIFRSRDTLLILMVAITLFVCVIALENKLKSNKIISKLSGASIFMYMLGWSYERLTYYLLGGTQILKDNMIYRIIFIIVEIVIVGIVAIAFKWFFDKIWNKVMEKYSIEK